MIGQGSRCDRLAIGQWPGERPRPQNSIEFEHQVVMNAVPIVLQNDETGHEWLRGGSLVQLPKKIFLPGRVETGLGR
jgi:hypothetical protein